MKKAINDLFVSTCKSLGLGEPVKEYKFCATRRWRCDYAFIDIKLAIEIEGGIWAYGRHNRAFGYIKDMEKYNKLTEEGWHLLRYQPKLINWDQVIEVVNLLRGGKMSKLLEQQFIFNYNLSLLLDFLRNKCYKFKIGEAFRTKEQAEIYAKRKQGIVNSQHCDQLAIDITLFKFEDGKYKAINEPDQYRNAGNYWKSLNPVNRWGGDWKSPEDPYHFEMKDPE